MGQRDGRRFLRAVSAAAVCLGAGAVLLVAQTATPTPAHPPATTRAATPVASTAPTAKSDAPKCGDCHTDLVADFASNPHARTPHGQPKGDINDFCSTCHGDGTKHMEAGGDASLISKPKGLTGSEDCRACHQNAHGPHDSFDTGVHSNTAAVNCLTCHSIHKSYPKSPYLLAAAPGPLCATCHKNETASFENKPYVHRLNRGGMTCLDCHSPHATRGETVKQTVQGELPCLSCHADKRGPFVFQHVSGSGGDCLSCHQSHGSNNPNMLLWARVDQLCLSCHSQIPPPKTYGSQPPSFHDLTLPRYRNCTTCHVAVHGSNVSPQLFK